MARANGDVEFMGYLGVSQEHKRLLSIDFACAAHLDGRYIFPPCTHTGLEYGRRAKGPGSVPERYFYLASSYILCQQEFSTGESLFNTLYSFLTKKRGERARRVIKGGRA